MTHPVIHSQGLKKRYGNHKALDGLNLEVPSGGVYALLGPNGAGKTTAVRVLSTLVPPDGGAAHVLGYDLVRDAHTVRSKIALTGQYASVDIDLTGQENLVLIGRLLGLGRAGARRRATEVLERFSLTDAAARQVRTYSGGMRRRLDLAASLIKPPQLLFLDEPTTGLDPRSRIELWTLVRQLVSDGTSVLLTTQYLDEADQLADRIGVLNSGRMVADGTADELKASVGGGSLQVRLLDHEQRDTAAQLLGSQLKAQPHLPPDPAVVEIPVIGSEAANDALTQLHHAGIDIISFSLGQPTLDEVFLSLTGHPTATEELA
ncbi:ATP-binding cassette domain-containing protein [Nesterenkonia haasae]|uniref:ATP-binding cassette domain-containing protein n=1 Tax=Nesterenkonia haasae TaxID=2587813 RepID=UPI001391097D|nr:ATP-binding cassette domain-containing protein [Nesterenkonia haasae]NDK30259.1 ATP-binding cassette domain-containing protein [Nesterenkonia haasae]